MRGLELPDISAACKTVHLPVSLSHIVSIQEQGSWNCMLMRVGKHQKEMCFGPCSGKVALRGTLF